MKREYLILAILAAVLALAGGGIFVYEKFRSRRDFLLALLPDAKRLEDLTGIKASVTLTQAGLESGSGSELALKHHNLFGIKAGRSWTGPSVNMATKEYVGGAGITTADNFRVYPSWYDSMKDWASLLARLYPKAYEAAKAGDISAFAAGLQKGLAGSYATDPSYPAQLASIYPTAQEVATV